MMSREALTRSLLCLLAISAGYTGQALPHASQISKFKEEKPLTREQAVAVFRARATPKQIQEFNQIKSLKDDRSKDRALELVRELAGAS